jgi:hypothetical protein
VNNSRIPLIMVCGNCSHWHETGPQRFPDGTVNATLPILGECREHLRSQQIVVNTPQGPRQAGWISGYPPVPADFTACSRFLEKVQLIT